MLISKKQNQTASILFNYYSNFEQALTALGKHHQGPQLYLENDPQSFDHVRIRQINASEKAPISVLKRDIHLANSNRLALFHLLTNVLNQLEDTTVN